MGKLLSKFAVIGALLVMSSSVYATQSHILELKGESVCVEHQDYTINMKVTDDWSLESFDAEDNEFTGEWTKVQEQLPLLQFDVTHVENYDDCYLMFDPEYRAQYIEQGMTFQEESIMLLGAVVMTGSLSGENITHESEELTTLEKIQNLKRKVIVRGNLPHVSMVKQHKIIDQLSRFELGCFLIDTGGLNGFWTHYVLMHPTQGRVEGKKLSELEDFILNKAPTVLATQERFTIFQEEIQKRVADDVVLASIPCGLMGDLLTLDYSENMTLVGIDIDPASLEDAAELAFQKGVSAQFIQQDAWKMDAMEEFDLISSNGLNIYVKDKEQVIALYEKFFDALKPGGTLVTSFLTYPPIPGAPSEWNMDEVVREDAMLQRILVQDILDPKWQQFKTTEEAIAELEQAGFDEIEIIPDRANIFPTVIAHKSAGG